MAAHNKILKTINQFTKKIDKDGKKVLNFSHSKCDKTVVFHKDIFDGFLAGVIDLRRGLLNLYKEQFLSNNSKFQPKLKLVGNKVETGC